LSSKEVALGTSWYQATYASGAESNFGVKATLASHPGASVRGREGQADLSAAAVDIQIGFKDFLRVRFS
jgi:hypothetical protein